MKRLFFAFGVILFLAACGSNGPETAKVPSVQEDTSVSSSGPSMAPEDTARLVAAVRMEFERINKAELTSRKYNWESPADCEPPYMGGTATYFYDRGTLVKIHNHGAEDHGEWKEDYYFKNGQLIFIYLDNAYGGAANPTEYKYQSRYYFNRDSLIKKLEPADREQGLDAGAIRELIRTAGRLYRAKDRGEISRILTCG